MRQEVEHHLEDNRCFCCGPLNPHGMHLKFYVEDEELRCDYTPEERFCGFTRVLHGGLQAALLDEVSIWAVAILRRRMAATADLHLSYNLPVRIGTPLVAAARIVREDDGRFWVEAALRGTDGKPRTTAQAELLGISRAHFRRLTGWPEVPPGWSRLFD